MESVTEQAIEAANSVVYRGEMVDPPSGVSVARWRAMIDQIIRNGPPKQFRRGY